jgi:prophage regulatory protein
MPNTKTDFDTSGFTRLKALAGPGGRVPVDRSTIYRWIGARRFPEPEQLGPNTVGWRNSELAKWEADPAGWAKTHAASA